MNPSTRYLPSILLAGAALAFGYTARTLQTGLGTVQAQSRGSQNRGQPDEPLDFQLSGIGPSSALTVYNPVEHVLYVYQGVTQGNSRVNCTFTLRVSRPGAAIDRQNCGPGSATP